MAAAESTSMTTSGRSTSDEALNCQKLAEGDKKAEAGKGKRMARVSQKYIDVLLNERATGTGMYRPSRLMQYVEEYQGSIDIRPCVARLNAIREELRAGDEAILEQYHRLGYAYAEVEEVCGPLGRSMPLPKLA